MYSTGSAGNSVPVHKVERRFPLIEPQTEEQGTTPTLDSLRIPDPPIPLWFPWRPENPVGTGTHC